VTDRRRGIPGVDALVESPAFTGVVEGAGRRRVVETLRAVQAEIRSGAAAGPEPPEDAGWYAAAVAARLERADRPSLRRVINATGVVLHTNLGRAPLAAAAQRAMVEASGYATLEVDLATGARGSRHDHCVDLLRELTGAEGALVVNNNAAAVVLALNTLAAGREVVISRGELVEIGGSFRIPEIMGRSGASMREVGTTNRTHPGDYEAAVGPATALFLKVHRSNFRLEGFTSEVDVGTLGGAARQAGVPLLHDLGSGALLDLEPLGLPREPTAREALAAGADVVTLSGDKLLGGPQAGIILGRAELIERMRENPLCRALRCDKLTLAALEATLALYRDPDRARAEIPVLRMLGATAEALAGRAHDLAQRLRDRGVPASTVAGTSAVGGGAYPGVELPTTLLALDPASGRADDLAGRLRSGEVPVVARVHDGAVVLDPRTVDVAEEAALISAVAAAVMGTGRESGAGVD
jgi:L-seryl-tRNA(Ser) seleniumtransferase